MSNTNVPEIEITTRDFDHTGGGDYPGNRGIVIEALRPGAPGFAFSSDLPSVFVTDNGEVDITDYRYPAADFLAWMDAIAPLIRAHIAAGSNGDGEAAS